MPDQTGGIRIPVLSDGTTAKIQEITALIQLAAVGIEAISGIVRGWLKARHPDGNYPPDVQLIADYIAAVEHTQASLDALRARMQ